MCCFKDATVIVNLVFSLHIQPQLFGIHLIEVTTKLHVVGDHTFV